MKIFHYYYYYYYYSRREIKSPCPGFVNELVMINNLFQFDALVDKLTGREMLQMFARLRGIPEHKIDAIVNATIKQLNLSNWADKMCGNYR